jgi:hypothetical protein
VRFADAGLAVYEGHPPFAALGSIPKCQQPPQFLIAADKPGNLIRALRLETARDRSLRRHAPGADWFGNSSNCVLLRVLANESAAEESAGICSDDDGVGRARSQIPSAITEDLPTACSPWSSVEADVLLEPARRDSGPAIAAGAGYARFQSAADRLIGYAGCMAE